MVNEPRSPFGSVALSSRRLCAGMSGILQSLHTVEKALLVVPQLMQMIEAEPASTPMRSDLSFKFDRFDRLVPILVPHS